jgi:hypothetical protein
MAATSSDTGRYVAVIGSTKQWMTMVCSTNGYTRRSPAGGVTKYPTFGVAAQQPTSARFPDWVGAERDEQRRLIEELPR